MGEPYVEHGKVKPEQENQVVETPAGDLTEEQIQTLGEIIKKRVAEDVAKKTAPSTDYDGDIATAAQEAADAASEAAAEQAAYSKTIRSDGECA